MYALFQVKFPVTQVEKYRYLLWFNNHPTYD